MPKTNTVMYFTYRDAANYKTHNSFIVDGVLTEGQIGRIMASLDSGEYFIPERLGMAPGRWNELNPELDHIWCELHRDGFENMEAPETSGISPDELVRRFEAMKGRWEEHPMPFDWCRPVEGFEE